MMLNTSVTDKFPIQPYNTTLPFYCGWESQSACGYFLKSSTVVFDNVLTWRVTYFGHISNVWNKLSVLEGTRWLVVCWITMVTHVVKIECFFFFFSLWKYWHSQQCWIFHHSTKLYNHRRWPSHSSYWEGATRRLEQPFFPKVTRDHRLLRLIPCLTSPDLKKHVPESSGNPWWYSLL